MARPRVGGRGGARRRVRPTTHQPFLLSTGLSLSGVTMGVNRPAKSGSNPIWPSLASDGSVPDWGVGWVSTRVNGSTTEFFTTCFDSPAINTVHMASPETTDGVTITRPTRSLITFNGNTSNNLISPGGFTRNQSRAFWDDLTQKYVCFIHHNDGSNFMTDLFEATAPRTAGWGTRVQRITGPLGAGVAAAQACEPMGLFRRSDNRWVMLIQTSQGGTADYGGARRHVGALLGPADTTLVGTWTNIGSGSYNAILTSPSGSEQYYHTGGWVHGDHLYLFAGIYDGSAAPPGGHSLANFPENCIHKVQLFIAPLDDVLNLTLVDSSWLAATGVDTDFDGGELIGANNIAEVGDEWRYYYGADQDTHHQSPEVTRLMGLATVARRRIGKVSGTGTVLLPVERRSTAAAISMNVASGTVKVELLNPRTGAVLNGFAQTDCDTITAGTFGQTVTWGGRSATPASFQPKLYLTSAEANYAVVS